MRLTVLIGLLTTVLACRSELVAPTVSIEPSNPTTVDDLLASVEDCSDCRYRWFRDGGAQSELKSERLSAEYTSKGEVWSVLVTSVDEDGSEGLAAESEVTVLNTAPEAPGLSAVLENDLVCKIEVESADVDEDTVDYTMSWLLDEELWSGAVGTTSIDGDTIAHDSLTPHQVWNCTAMPFDGEEYGSAASASVTVACPDADGDGYGDPTCGGMDCDDTDASLNLDDADGDGYSTCDGDCDDQRAGFNPGALDSLVFDRDCDGTVSGGSLSLSDYKFVGKPNGDFAGSAVSSAGDVDGDGLDDLLVGASGDDDVGLDHGAVYIILGSSLGGTSTIDLSDADYKLIGEAEVDFDVAGYSLSSAGDVDGDGLDDVLVGAPGNDNDHGAVDAGAAYVVLGSSLNTSSTIELSNADYKFTGEAEGDYAGWSVASAGDVDGDGLDDLMIGSYGDDEHGANSGAAYVVLGSSLNTSSTIELSNADYKFTGEVEGDYAGWSVASAGDVDGDGLDDVLVGAYARDEGGTNSGAAYVVLGSRLSTSSTIELSTADYKFVGEYKSDYVGWSVSSAGDVDGDGLDDVLVGAYGDDVGGNTAGAAYVVLGTSLGTISTIDLSNADYKLVGENTGDYAGYSVSSAGDVDGDGLGDVLVGAIGDDSTEVVNAGAAYVVLGSSLGMSSSIDLSNADYKLTGESFTDAAGISVSSAGDVDGDGLGDVFVGAHHPNDGGTDSGAAYLMLTGG